MVSGLYTLSQYVEAPPLEPLIALAWGGSADLVKARLEQLSKESFPLEILSEALVAAIQREQIDIVELLCNALPDFEYKISAMVETLKQCLKEAIRVQNPPIAAIFSYLIANFESSRDAKFDLLGDALIQAISMRTPDLHTEMELNIQKEDLERIEVGSNVRKEYAKIVKNYLDIAASLYELLLDCDGSNPTPHPILGESFFFAAKTGRFAIVELFCNCILDREYNLVDKIEDRYFQDAIASAAHQGFFETVYQCIRYWKGPSLLLSIYRDKWKKKLLQCNLAEIKALVSPVNWVGLLKCACVGRQLEINPLNDERFLTDLLAFGGGLLDEDLTTLVSVAANYKNLHAVCTLLQSREIGERIRGKILQEVGLIVCSWPMEQNRGIVRAKDPKLFGEARECYREIVQGMTDKIEDQLEHAMVALRNCQAVIQGEIENCLNQIISAWEVLGGFEESIRIMKQHLHKAGSYRKIAQGLKATGHFKESGELIQKRLDSLELANEHYLKIIDPLKVQARILHESAIVPFL